MDSAGVGIGGRGGDRRMGDGACLPQTDKACAGDREPKESKRNHQFDLLRIVFSVLVLLEHAYVLTTGELYSDLFSQMTHTTATFGAIGVDGFFLLSGYLIVRSWESDPECLNYLRKRVLRIVPGFVVAVLLSTLLVGWLAPGVEHFFSNLGGVFWISIVLLVSPITPHVLPGLTHDSVNGSLWSIAYEFRCYLIVALFGMAGWIRRRAFWLLATAILFTIVSLPSLENRLAWPSSAISVLIGESHHDGKLTTAFFVGGMFYLFRDVTPFRRMIAIAAFAAICACIWIRLANIEPVLVLCGAYLIFFFAKAPIRALRWMRKVPDISYGIYLYGWPVESLWIWYHRGNPAITFLVSLVICIGLGWLSWHLVERPMLRLKRNGHATITVTKAVPG